MASKPIPEDSILKPRHPSSDLNSDDWPEFELRDVRVYRPGNPSQQANLLEASVHNPLTLIGYLEPVARDQTSLLLQSTPKRAPLIEIAEVRTYAYGECKGGKITIWAAGKAGWFTLSPARAYKPVWEEMTEAVALFYWIADAYREKRRASNRKKAAALPDYTAAELWQKYADSMPQLSREDARKSLYKHKDFLFASMIAEKEGVPWKKNPLYLHLRERFPEAHDVVKVRVTGIAASSGRRSRIVKSQNARQASTSSSGSGSLKRKRGQQEPDAPVVRTRKAVERRKKPEKTSSQSDAKLARTSPSRDESRAGSESDPGTPEEEEDSSHWRHAMKGRSALRPRASKASKGAVKDGKVPMPDENAEIDDLATTPIPVKQQRGAQAGLPVYLTHPNAMDMDEGIDMPPSRATSDASTGAAESGHDGDDEVPSADLARRLNHKVDPVQEDTWVCALDGCSHKVYAASLSDSQRLIREHYALHAYDDDDRVQLVKKLQHPSLPVGHLMEMVKMRARQEGFSSSSAEGGANVHSRFPMRPVRRY